MYTPIFAMTPYQMTWLPVFCGMVAGLVVLLVWKAFHWNAMMYEIVPGFIANILMILIVDRAEESGDGKGVRNHGRRNQGVPDGIKVICKWACTAKRTYRAGSAF